MANTVFLTQLASVVKGLAWIDCKKSSVLL
jgi:hypothetical protein